MTYQNVEPGIFLERPNRFIAYVEIGGRVETVHVKNTGRCRELLLRGTRVYCQRCENPARKTKYDLIAVQKGSLLINMDSQATNAAAAQWLRGGGLGTLEALRAETVHGDSRFDFSFMKDGRQCFLEVKGVTLENDSVCMFPDAPTARGTKHLHGLIRAAQEGYGAYILFVIQMARAKYLRPNAQTDPDFAAALCSAAAQGVRILAMTCSVEPDAMTIDAPVAVQF